MAVLFVASMAWGLLFWGKKKSDPHVDKLLEEKAADDSAAADPV